MYGGLSLSQLLEQREFMKFVMNWLSLQEGQQREVMNMGSNYAANKLWIDSY